MSIDRRLYRCRKCPAVFLTELALRGHKSTHAEDVIRR